MLILGQTLRSVNLFLTTERIKQIHLNYIYFFCPDPVKFSSICALRSFNRLNPISFPMVRVAGNKVSEPKV